VGAAGLRCAPAGTRTDPARVTATLRRPRAPNAGNHLIDGAGRR